MAVSNTHLSLDQPGDGGGSVVDAMPDRDVDMPDRQAQHSVLRNQILAVLDRYLSATERRIVVGYFGIGQDTPLTIEDIGIQIGITARDVRKLKDRAMRKLARARRGRPLQECAASLTP
jgi:RNA polymerase primary sigma factor